MSDVNPGDLLTVPAKSKATVHEALAAVMAELPGIGKGDRSPEGYQYRGIEAVTKELQPLLARHGVVISPCAEIVDIRPSPAMKEGWQDVYMRVTWTVTGPDGSTLTCHTNGIGRDKSDKGANKAQTQAFKYLLLHLFCIADAKDDADGQTYEHDRQERPVLMHPNKVRSLIDRCEKDGIDVAAVVRTASGERTSDPHELRADEADAVKAALDALAAPPDNDHPETQEDEAA